LTRVGTAPVALLCEPIQEPVPVPPKRANNEQGK
jgi:hypothetical protein